MGRDRNTDVDRESASHGADEGTATRQSSETGNTTDRDDSASATAERGAGESGRPEPVGTATENGESGHRRETVREGERELRPAVTRHDPDEEETAAEVLRPTGSLEPQEIDRENAAFVLLGVALIAGLLLAAVAGI
jgi:hypothetical protein